MSPPFFAPDRRVTPAFVLRSYFPGDGPRLEESVTASHEHLRPFMTWSRSEYAEGEAESTARRFRADYINGKDFVIAIVSPDGALQLGGTGLHPRDRGVDQHCAEIGMWIRKDRAGTGLGTSVLVEMLRWGFDEWPWLRIAWRCSTANPASARVAEKAGMQLECVRRRDRFDRDGQRCDSLAFAALEGEWTPPVV